MKHFQTTIKITNLQAALLDHLILVLDEELDTLDRGGSRLGGHGGNTGEHKVLGKTEFFSFSHLECSEEQKHYRGQLVSAENQTMARKPNPTPIFFNERDIKLLIVMFREIRLEKGEEKSSGGGRKQRP